MEVVLKFIKKDAWAGVSKYPGCFTGIGPIWTRSGNRYTGLSEEDARRLEKELGYSENYLSPQSSFWDTFAIRVTDKPLFLHIEKPEDELKYLFAKGHKRVANGTKHIKPGNDFVLINEELEAEQTNKNNKIKREAFAAFTKMSVSEMRKALRLFGFKSDDTKADICESTLFSFIENDPQKFLNIWVNNKDREAQFLIETAISKNIIRRQKNLYYYGTDVIGHSLNDAIAFLNDKQNNDIRLVILQETEA